MADIVGKYYQSNYMAHQQGVVGSFSEIHQHSDGGVSPRCSLTSLGNLDNSFSHLRVIGHDLNSEALIVALVSTN